MKKKLGVLVVLALLCGMVFFTGTVDAAPSNVTVTFIYNDSVTPNNPVTITYGQVVPEPTEPTRTGYVFNGWHEDSSCEVPYDFSQPVTSNYPLYAHWVAEGTFEAEIEGSLVNSSGSPLQGYTAKLWSIPVEDTTSSAGAFSFGDAYYIDHRLLIFDSVGTPLRSYDLSFVLGTAPSSVVDEGLSEITITYTSDTRGIAIPLEFDITGSIITVTDGEVTFDQTPVTNPRTGDNSSIYLILAAGMALVILAGVLIKKKTGNKE